MKHPATAAAASTAGMARRKPIISWPSAPPTSFGWVGLLRWRLLSAEPLLGIISNNRSFALHRIILTVERAGILLGLFVGAPMFESIIAFLLVLSVGILFAHALDAFRS
jgi:hypothetical protein